MTAQLPALPSKERLEEIAISYGSGHHTKVNVKDDEVLQIVEALLAGMEQEPEAYLIERHEGFIGYGNERKIVDALKYNPMKPSFWTKGAQEHHTVTPLYAAPVVSEQQVSVVKPVMFIDGDISSEDADKMARILHDFNAEEPIDNGEYGSAYQGAREDLAIWKRRALEAEEKIRTAPVAVPDEVVKSLDSLFNKKYFRVWVKEPPH